MNKVKTKQKKDTTNYINIIINIIIILAYLFVGVLSFPKENQSFNQTYYFVIGILFLIIINFVYYKDIKRDFIEFKQHLLKNFLSVLLKGFLCVVVVLIGNFLKDLLFGWIQMSSYELIYPNIGKYTLYVAFVMILYTPIVEGIIFNKSLHNLIKNNVLFVVLSSLIYGIMQVGIEFNNILSVISIIPYMLFFMVISITFVKKKNIIFPILIWMIYSIITFLTQYTAVLGW